MGGFQPAFAAVFGDGLVEQVLAIVQANSEAAITAFGATQFQGTNPAGAYLLDPIADWHKGPIASPQTPCLTVTAGAPTFDAEAALDLLDYQIPLACWLDISYTDPEQIADWALKYMRVMHQIFSTLTTKFTDWTVFTTALAITWPANTEARTTAPPAAGTVKNVEFAWRPAGVLEKSGDGTPTKVELPFEMMFHMMEI